MKKKSHFDILIETLERILWELAIINDNISYRLDKMMVNKDEEDSN